MNILTIFNISKLKKTRHLGKKFFITGLHTIFLVALTIMLQYIGNIRFDEIAFFKSFAIAKHNILQIDRKPVGDSVIFLDVSKEVVTTADTGMNWGKVAITDRALLARFFAILNQHKNEYKFVICDVGFIYPSAADTTLRPVIEKSSRVYIALTLDKGKSLKPLFKGIYGATDYTLNDGDFVKYPIFYNDSTKSLPIVIVEEFAGKKFEHAKGLTYENNHITFNTIIPEFYYRDKDLVEDTLGKKAKRTPNLFHLGEILPSDDFFNAYLKNKYILIGDFYQDKHGTYLGKMPGPVILFDTFLTLRNTNLAISAVWIVILLVTFFLISFHLFFGDEIDLKSVEEKIKVSVIREFVVKYLSYLGILILLNIFSYVFFGVFISLFYLATYLTIVHTIIEKVVVWKKLKSLISLLNS